MFKTTIDEAISTWNKNNPTLREITREKVAKHIMISYPNLSNWKTKTPDAWLPFLKVVFRDESIAIERWKEISEIANMHWMKRLNRICEFLDCEITDIIKKV